MYDIFFRKEVEKIFKKLSKKNKITLKHISKKIKEIQENPYRFKPLKKPMQGFWRVHIGSYVLIYSINERDKQVVIERYRHHDEVYNV